MYVCDTVLIMLTGWIDSYSRKIIHNTHHTPTFLLKWPQIKKKSKKNCCKTPLLLVIAHKTIHHTSQVGVIRVIPYTTFSKTQEVSALPYGSIYDTVS
jgi:hypothetical protein